MNHYFVSFEAWAPNGDVWHISPHTWVDAETVEHAELVARKRLGHRVRADIAMTTCVQFAEEDYQREMTRLRAYYKSRGEDELGLNPSYN